MRTIPQNTCGIIPPHILARLAGRTRAAGPHDRERRVQRRERPAGHSSLNQSNDQLNARNGENHHE